MSSDPTYRQSDFARLQWWAMALVALLGVGAAGSGWAITLARDVRDNEERIITITDRLMGVELGAIATGTTVTRLESKIDTVITLLGGPTPRADSRP